LISSLIPPPGVETAPFDDLIEGTGKGLIFFVARATWCRQNIYCRFVSSLIPRDSESDRSTESISEYTQRPLYNIGCCDLGGPPPAVEKTLRSSLRIATKWNAIVLLDEANVFMEERSRNELARNQLVSGSFSYYIFVTLIKLTECECSCGH
jgi:hypothetical protein